MKISTGIPLFNTPVDAPNTENQSYNVLFGPNSTTLISHTIDVAETSIVVKAYGFTGNETITVNTVSTNGIATMTEPMVLNGKTVQLSATNNTLVLDISGRYVFVLSAGLGAVNCVFHESPLGLWAYGLGAFATVQTANAVVTQPNIATPLTATTVTITPTSGVYTQSIQPAGTLASLTVSLSQGSLAGQYVSISFNQAVTSLTISTTASGFSGIALPTSATVTSSFGFVWNASNSTWIRVL